MNEDQALTAMALVARRSAMWVHDVICSRSINDGQISADAVDRFKKDILEALAILDRPDDELFKRVTPDADAA